MYTRNLVCAVFFLILYLAIPVIIGTLAVIWKDVLMAAFFITGIALIEYTKSRERGWLTSGLFILATLSLFLGVCTRHNAMAGAIPLFFYLAWIVCAGRKGGAGLSITRTVLLGLLISGSVFFTKLLVDVYSLPGLEKLPDNKSAIIQSVRVLDVAGASLCVGRNFFSEAGPDLTLETIRTAYDPRHANLSRELLERKDVYLDINGIWLDVMLKHPICFLSNKLDLAKYLIGANEGEQFLITQKRIRRNEYGYKLQPSSIRDTTFQYIENASQFYFLKPWFIYVLSVIALMYMATIKKLTLGYVAIYTSAAFYFLGLIGFGNAADARLLFYTTSILTMFSFVAIVELGRRLRQHVGFDK